MLRNFGLLACFSSASASQYDLTPPHLEPVAREVSSTAGSLIELLLLLIWIRLHFDARSPVSKTPSRNCVEKSLCTRNPPSELTVSFKPVAAAWNNLGSVRWPGVPACATATSCWPKEGKRSPLLSDIANDPPRRPSIVTGPETGISISIPLASSSSFAAKSRSVCEVARARKSAALLLKSSICFRCSRYILFPSLL
jgi:hypothetical protein